MGNKKRVFDNGAFRISVSQDPYRAIVQLANLCMRSYNENRIRIIQDALVTVMQEYGSERYAEEPKMFRQHIEEACRK